MKSLTKPKDSLFSEESTSSKSLAKTDFVEEIEIVSPLIPYEPVESAIEFAALKKELFLLRAENIALKRIVLRLSKTLAISSRK